MYQNTVNITPTFQEQPHNSLNLSKDCNSIRGVARLFSQGGPCVFQGGPVLSEAKRDRARHAQHAECSGGLQGGLGAQPPAGSRGGAPRKILRK